MSTAVTELNTSNLTRRQLGAYYTPLEVSEILADWAIKNKNDLILEPGFGGCGFLSAAVNRLSVLGKAHPERSLSGCDIDISAFEHLSREIGITSVGERFLLKDFLNTRVTDFPEKSFDVVMGNPPYVSIENMSPEQREIISESGYLISKKASLWAYFVLHALKFLNMGGRVAWVLPSSFLYADYGKQVQKQLKESFEQVVVVELNEKIFKQEGTNESAVIVLAENYKKLGEVPELRILHANKTEDLREAVNNWGNCRYIGESLGDSPVLSMLPSHLRENYTAILKSPYVKSFEDLADVRIGMVTGDSKYLVISSAVREENNLPMESVRRVLLKGSCIDSIELNKAAFEALDFQGKRCWLFHPSEGVIHCAPIKNYIEKYDEKELQNNKTFAKRAKWYLPDDELIPDAFLSYISDFGPRLILNTYKVNGTNSLHRVYWKASYKAYYKRLIAISMLTTFSQLGAEIEGKHYGSGVLKLDPSSCKRLPVHLPNNIPASIINETFSKIKNLMNNDDKNGAMALADNLIFGEDRIFFFRLDLLKEALLLIRSK